MIEEIYKNIYQVKIPLPNNPLRELNSYFILSEDRNLIIDTGFNREECIEAFEESIKALGMDMNKTDILITHLHSDHSGLASYLKTEGSKVYGGAIDCDMVNKMTEETYWNHFKDYTILFGLEEDKITFDNHPGYKYCPREKIDFTKLFEGDEIKLGDYTFKVVDIPGHTPGHIGLYEPTHKLFFCGDTILARITPNIAFWGFEWGDILQTYFNSLGKIYNMEIDHLFSAHRYLVTNHRFRINELVDHHEARLKEILEILKNGENTVRNVAAAMHWELRYDNWYQFPPAQKWFASGEAMSHLEHLVYTENVKRENRDGVLYYSMEEEAEVPENLVRRLKI